MRIACVLLAACGVAAPLFAQPAASNAVPVAQRVAQQNALFEEFFQAGLKRNPTGATSLGDFRYNNQLGDASLEAIVRNHAEDDAFLARLKAIPTDGMPDTDLISHQLLVRQLERADSNFDLKNYEMPINQQGGIHTGLADLALSVPFDSVQHYEDYIARLHQVPHVLSQTADVMRQGLKDG